MKTCIPPAVLLWSFVLCLFSPAAAQVVLDGTVGPSGEMSIPLRNDTYTVRESYGERVGGNLFHSLKTLDIRVEEAADFAAASDIDNIVARITGGSSRIDGTLTSTLTRSGLISNANLFLLNPSGIVFGPNARLDLGGSFHVSTADYLRMGETDRFYARPSESDVLSAAAPQAFGFLTDSPAGIALEGGIADGPDPGLKVKAGETISFVGGDVRIEGIRANGATVDRITAPEGRIDIAGVASRGEVEPSDAGLYVPERGGDVAVTDGAVLKTSGSGSGDIYIRGGAFLLENSTILADNVGDADGGTVDIRADAVRVDDARIFSDNQSRDAFGEDAAFGSGEGGDIHLSANESLEITNNSSVFTDTQFEGNGTADGRAGSMTLSAKRIAITTGSTVSSDTYGTGDGGTITVEASESVTLSDDGRIFSGTLGRTDGAGDGGSILIRTPRFTMERDAKINTDTRNGDARGGDVLIEGFDGGPADRIAMIDSQISGAAINNSDSAAAGGSVTLNALEIQFTEGARIRSESLGAGRGGDVTLSAPDGTVRLAGASAEGVHSQILTTSESEEPDAGNAGDIVVEASDIVFEKGAGITAGTEGPGDAGTIAISAAHLLMRNGGHISSSTNSTGAGGSAGSIDVAVSGAASLTDPGTIISTETAGQGPAGDIQVRAGSLSIQKYAAISSASRNPGAAGDAGTITISAAGDIALTEGGEATTEAVNAGGGRMYITSGNMLYLEDSRITTSVQQGAENGGDIDAVARFIVLKNGQIIAKAFEGRGGNIRIAADQFITTPDSVVSASSELGIDGDIFIESPVTDISSFLAVLPDQFLDAGQWIVKSCAEQAVEAASRFIVKEREGTPMPVDDWLASPF